MEVVDRMLYRWEGRSLNPESNAVEAVVVTTNWGEAVWVLNWAPHTGLITITATTAIAPIMKRRKTESWVNW